VNHHCNVKLARHTNNLYLPIAELGDNGEEVQSIFFI